MILNALWKLYAKIQEGKHFEPIEAVKRKEFIEPKNTNREIYTFSMDIQTPKVSLSYKLDGIEDVKKAHLCRMVYSYDDRFCV